MPRHELLLGQVSPALRPAQRLVVECQQPLVKALCPVCQFGNLHSPAERQTVRPAVEQFVVQDAQRQSVYLRVRTARLVPLDVCRFESQLAVSEPHVVAADGTAVLVSGQNALPPRERPRTMRTDNDANRVACVQFHMIRRKTRPPRSIKEITSAMGPLTADEARRATEYIRLACEAIRSTWSPEVLECRCRGINLQQLRDDEGWTVPEIRVSESLER